VSASPLTAPAAVAGWPTERLEPGVGTAHDLAVWCADLDRPLIPLPRLHALLDAGERRRVARFADDQDARRFVAARGLQRLLLGACTGIDPPRLRLRTAPGGQPTLVAPTGPPLWFSHSRSGGRALYAVSRVGRVGVDIEVARRVPEALAIARHWCTEGERAFLARTSGRQRSTAFLALWVGKEAYGKARGDGLSDALRDVHVGVGPAEGGTGRPIGAADEERWWLHRLPGLTGVVAALVVEGGRALPRCRTLGAVVERGPHRHCS
jgi:4'-phosphopantetheinyl transferase